VYHLAGPQWTLVREMSKRSCIGGRSSFRIGSRVTTLMDDQMVGHSVGYVATRHLFGSAQKYIEARAEADSHPFVGDGGVDILHSNIDFKGTRWGKVHPIDRRFLIHERDYRDDKVFVFGMVKLYRTSCDVVLVGYAHGSQLLACDPGNPDQRDIWSSRSLSPGFRGYCIRGVELNPLPRFVWKESPC